MNDVLILRKDDKTARVQAKRAGLQVVVSDGYDAEFDRALIVEPGMAIPWGLVDYGLHFLERWDAAAPLWRYGELAETVGTPADRKRTAKLVRDLRVLLYAHELLFVRGSGDGRALLDAWQEERADYAEPRLAFLRALYRVKPRFCALPRSWAGEHLRHAEKRTLQHVPEHLRPFVKPSGEGLVRVEIKPGVYVRCKPGQEQDVLKRLGNLHRPRSERRG